jgi:hemoglobin
MLSPKGLEEAHEAARLLAEGGYTFDLAYCSLLKRALRTLWMVLDDELTGPFFNGLDMKAQVTKQVAFMTWALGGPSEYKGRDLRTAHAGLVKRGLNDQHFDAVARHLEATLRELGVADELIKEAVGIVGAQRDVVLNR